MTNDSSLRVFISYSHDSPAHVQRVLALADRLRTDGVDARIDQYVTDPPEGWPRWMERQLVECDVVLLVCTPTYRDRFDRKDPGGPGKGAKWEALLTEQLLYEAGTHNEKLVPVLFEEGKQEDVPLALRAYTRYELDAGYDDLYRRLTGQPKTPAPALGARRVMPPAARPGLEAAGQGSEGTGLESVRAPAPPLETLSEEALVDELARVLTDADEARLVVRRAGFSPGHIPRFRVPIVFWTNMVEAARNGMIAGGVGAVVEAAALMYPGNALFHRYRAR